VSEVDKRQIGTGNIGPVTQKIRSLYKDLISKEVG
jgi:branched-chain amino acid aminotransferase